MLGFPFQPAAKAFRDYFDPFGIVTSTWAVQQAWLTHPALFGARLQDLGTQLWALQFYSLERLYGLKCGDAFPAVEWDERFQEPVWTENPYLDIVKQSYLLYSRWLEDAIFAAPGVPDKTRRRAAFWARQALNALAPNNYFFTNPHALSRFMETAGGSLLTGVGNWIRDCSKGSVRMVDENAFAVGDNLANTPGAVVFRNQLLELIQYAPSTEQVRTVPLLIVAPWINKYYILDIAENKSLIRYLVGEVLREALHVLGGGFTVFVTSWKNPTADMRETTFDDYMLNGVLPAVEAVRAICQVPQVHAVGYCIGGTLLAALMGWLRGHGQHGERRPIAHWTLLATLVDFSQPGDIEVFIDEDSVAAIERMMSARGYLDGGELALSFRMLRPNSLIWNYFVQNYLYGQEPPPFDVLYWNMDSTRLPEAMHSFYLREFYLHNRLVQPDAVTLGGRRIDLRNIEEPLYAVGTEQDHITPWRETFKICGLIRGPVRYVLATSGHIMGIISPPVDPPKRRYWVGDATGRSDAEQWRDGVAKVPGSWWEDWCTWLDARCGALRTPPVLGSDAYPALEPAPGTYVLNR